MGFVAVLVCVCMAAANARAYNVGREWGYRPDTFAVDVTPNYLQQASQNLFWDKLGPGGSTNWSGSNQVGGGWWGTIQNKLPFLAGLFGRMELPPTAYGAPAYGLPAVYGPPPAPVYGPPPQFYYPVRQFPQGGIQVTDDAVVVSAPGVPPFAPAPAPTPAAPGYEYRRPQVRLELPNRNALK